jgi:hypothetical protein
LVFPFSASILGLSVLSLPSSDLGSDLSWLFTVAVCWFGIAEGDVCLAAEEVGLIVVREPSPLA